MFTSQEFRTLELDVCTNMAGCNTMWATQTLAAFPTRRPGYMDAAQLYWPSMETLSKGGKYALC